MTGSRLERNSVFYRFASDATVEKIEFDGREIAVGDLKQAIADKKSLPKFDLVLTNEATNEVYTRDGAMLPRNMSITVRRTPPQNSKRPAVVHLEHDDIWSRMVTRIIPKKEETETQQLVRKACPPEYLCPLCCDLFEDPHIARCCGRSACSRCFSEHDAKVCPLCMNTMREDGTPIPNPQLADSVASLNLEYFVLPKGKDECQQVCKEECKEEPVEEPIPVEEACPGNVKPKVEVTGSDLHKLLTAPGLSSGTCALPCEWSGAHAVQPPPTFLWPPPQGVAVRPCMLTPEQFHAWQESIREACSDSESDSDRRRRRMKRARKGRTRKKNRSPSLASQLSNSSECVRHRQKHKKSQQALPSGTGKKVKRRTSG